MALSFSVIASLGNYNHMTSATMDQIYQGHLVGFFWGGGGGEFLLNTLSFSNF